MASDIWPVIHAERAALAADLENLSAEQWSTPSLCAGWTVHEVLAHQVSTATLTLPTFLVKFAGAGFNFHTFAAKQVAEESAGGPAATLAAFRAIQNSTSAPPGPKETWLGEALVHGEDIRRPLGIKHDYPLDAVARMIAFYSKRDMIIGGKKRVAGLQLRATDLAFNVGVGPLVEGPAVALLLATTGRKVALDELQGPGVEILRSR